MIGIYKSTDDKLNGTLRFFEDEEGFSYAQADLTFADGTRLDTVYFLDEAYGAVPPDDEEEQAEEADLTVALTVTESLAEETGEEDLDELTPGDIVFVVKELDEEKIVILPSAGFYRDIEDAPDEVPSYTLLRAENE